MTVPRFQHVSRFTALAALVLVAAMSPVRACAQSDFNSVLKHYDLTMPKVKAWEQASVAMAQALKASPRKAELESEMSAEDASFDDMIAKMDAIPEIRRATHQARLTTREFVTVGLVLMLTMTTDQMQQAYPEAKVPENVNPANLTFMRAHKAEVQRSLDAVKAASDTTS